MAILLNVDISQGSVATCLRYDGIFKYDFVANVPLSLPVKDFRKSANIWGSYGKSLVSCFSLTDGVYTS